eukprot:1157340-Pelagomonas_calceolata.AAC.13
MHVAPRKNLIMLFAAVLSALQPPTIMISCCLNVIRLQLFKLCSNCAQPPSCDLLDPPRTHAPLAPIKWHLHIATSKKPGGRDVNIERFRCAVALGVMSDWLPPSGTGKRAPRAVELCTKIPRHRSHHM